jgi:hypothetical protein
MINPLANGVAFKIWISLSTQQICSCDEVCVYGCFPMFVCDQGEIIFDVVGLLTLERFRNIYGSDSNFNS